MKRNKEDALRWLAQAEHDFKVARHNFQAQHYSDTCFMAEQSAQKALKAYLLTRGKRFVWEHAIQSLAEMCQSYDEAFKDLIEEGMILDRYYITTRYPDALAPPAVPYKSYTKKEGAQALRIAGKVLNLVRQRIV